jgi:hypothetical protein
MLKKISDAAPAAFIALGSTSILFGVFRESQTIERLTEVLTWPFSVLWLVMLTLGSVADIVGICLRSRVGKVGRPQTIGQGLEMFGTFAVGSMFVAYACVLAAQFPTWSIFPSLCWFGALASAFLGPWIVIVRDIVRAHRNPKD